MASDHYSPVMFMEKLSESSFLKEIDINLPNIIMFLEKHFLDQDFSSVLKILFKDGLTVHNLESVQALYIQDVLEVTRRIFCDSLQNALELKSYEKMPETKRASTQQFLNVALDILESYSLLLDSLLTQPVNIQASKLNSVPKNLVAVVHNAFSHCKESKSTYGDLFCHFSETLSNLFKKSFDVQTHLMRFLDEKMNFNCNLEEDLSLLLEVLERVSGIGEVAVGMELKLAVDQWKIFAKLACKHASQLKQRLDLVVPLSALSATLQLAIQTVTSEQLALDIDIQVRYLKLGNFILKVIIKLCDLYSGYLGDCQKHLLELLINLNKNDQLIDESNDLYSGFRSYLSIGSLPLLTHLLPDKQFVLEFKNLCCELTPLTSQAKLGCFTLTVNIVRKLIKSDKSVQKLWWNEDLLQSVIYIVRDCSGEIENVINLDDKEGYSCLVASSSLLMAAILTRNEFQNAERVLFSTLCTGDFFSSVFVQDLLCLLARITKENVVIKWLEWLKTAISCAEGPVRVHLSLLEKRLMNFLSSKTLSSFNRPNQEDIDVTLVPPSPQTEDFTVIIKYLSNVNIEVKDLSKICAWICELWQAAERCKPRIEPQEQAIRGLHWWTLLVNRLVYATNTLLNYFSDNQLFKCLDTMRSVVTGVDSYCRSSVSLILPAAVLLMSQRSSVKVPVVNLACTLCRDSDPIVVQLVLEALCPSLLTGDLYSAMVMQQPSLEDILAPYISKRPKSSNASDDFEVFDSFSSDVYQHKCSTRQQKDQPAIEMSLTESCPIPENIDTVINKVGTDFPPAKRIKISQEFDLLIHQGTQLCGAIDKYLATNTLTSDQVPLLESFIKELANLKKYL